MQTSNKGTQMAYIESCTDIVSEEIQKGTHDSVHEEVIEETWQNATALQAKIMRRSAKAKHQHNRRMTKRRAKHRSRLTRLATHMNRIESTDQTAQRSLALPESQSCCTRSYSAEHAEFPVAKRLLRNSSIGQPNKVYPCPSESAEKGISGVSQLRQQFQTEQATPGPVQPIYSLTKHARKRVAQRGLTTEDMNYILNHAKIYHAAGATIYYLRRIDIPPAEQRRQKRLAGTAIIKAKDRPQVITTWRNRKNGLRNIRHKLASVWYPEAQAA